MNSRPATGAAAAAGRAAPRISTDGSPVSAWAIPTQEELTILGYALVALACL